MKKWKTYAILMLMCFCFLSLPMAAQAKTSKKTLNAINKVVKTYFNAQKKFDTHTMNKCLKRAQITQIRKTGYFAQYLRKQNRKFSYKILSTKVSGQKATVRVKCTYRSAYELFAAAIEDAALYFGDDPDALSDTEQIYDYVSYYIQQNEKRYPARSRTKTLTLKLVYRKKTWQIQTFNSDMTNLLWLDYHRLLSDLT